MPLGAVCLQACECPSGDEDPTQWHSIPPGIGQVKHKPLYGIPEGRNASFTRVVHAVHAVLDYSGETGISTLRNVVHLGVVTAGRSFGF